MNILLVYYKKYKIQGLKAPESVTIVTNKYEADNNIVKQFIDENIVAGTSKECITKDELKNIFQKDYALKSHFGKLSGFVTQLENALCSEMKLDLNLLIYLSSLYPLLVYLFLMLHQMDYILNHLHINHY